MSSFLFDNDNNTEISKNNTAIPGSPFTFDFNPTSINSGGINTFSFGNYSGGSFSFVKKCLLDEFFETDEIFDEVLSYFTLIELNSIRQVSKRLKSLCQTRKEFHFKRLLLSTNKNENSIANSLHKTSSVTVQIIGLQSLKGQALNGTIGSVSWKNNNNCNHQKQQKQAKEVRIPIKITHEITAEEHIVLVKPCNLNIYPSKKDIQKHNNLTTNLHYSNTSRVRDLHGMLVQQILSTSKWQSNVLSGFQYFNGDHEEFTKLPPFQHPAMIQATSTMYTYWNVKPSLTGRIIDERDWTIIESNIANLLNFDLSHFITLYSPKNLKQWGPDGNDGMLLIRNMVRYMQTWDEERIFGIFWVCKIVSTGTLLVKINYDQEDEFYDHESLGQVYLVKGLASQVGEDCQILPSLFSMTLLPLYHFLVYDGVMLCERRRCTSELKTKLMNHVQNALDQGAVITHGKSYADGLWDSEPPLLPTLINDDTELDWSNCYANSNSSNSNGNSHYQNNHQREDFNFTPKQKKIAKKIAHIAKRKGILPYDRFVVPLAVHDMSSKNQLVFRRAAYTEEENPDQLCMILFNMNPLNIFNFKNELTYDMDELLMELLNAVKQIDGVPQLICPDELELVEPLKKILNESLEAVGMDNNIIVHWYPPPSPEETRCNELMDRQYTHPFNPFMGGLMNMMM